MKMLLQVRHQVILLQHRINQVARPIQAAVRDHRIPGTAHIQTGLVNQAPTRNHTQILLHQDPIHLSQIRAALAIAKVKKAELEAVQLGAAINHQAVSRLPAHLKVNNPKTTP